MPTNIVSPTFDAQINDSIKRLISFVKLNSNLQRSRIERQQKSEKYELSVAGYQLRYFVSSDSFSISTNSSPPQKLRFF